MLREENTYKPPIAKIISESGGVVPPDDVAKGIVEGLIHYRFEMFANFDGEALGTLKASEAIMVDSTQLSVSFHVERPSGLVSSGFNPPDTLGRLLLEMISMPILRAVAVGYHLNWNRLIRSHFKDGSFEKDKRM